MLEGGITIISLIPVRGEPRHSAELVTQLLFGEMYTVLEKTRRLAANLVFFRPLYRFHLFEPAYTIVRKNSEGIRE